MEVGKEEGEDGIEWIGRGKEGIGEKYWNEESDEEREKGEIRRSREAT